MDQQMFWLGFIGTVAGFRIFKRLQNSSRHLVSKKNFTNSKRGDEDGTTTLQLNVTVQEEGYLTLRIQSAEEDAGNSDLAQNQSTQADDFDASSLSDDDWMDFPQENLLYGANLASNRLISIDSLAALGALANVTLKESVADLLVQRAVETRGFPEFLMRIIANPATRLEDLRKAVVVLQQLTKTESHRELLVSKNALDVLCELLVRNRGDEITFRYVIIAIYRLLTIETVDKVAVVNSGILKPLAEFLQSCPSHNNDLKYWALLLIHSFCLNEKTSEYLCQADVHFVPILGELCRLSLGNNNMQKMALHGLIRLTSSRDPDGLARLEALVNRGLCEVVCACLKNEDYEIASWAVFLLHELSSVNAAKTHFVHSRGILRSLMTLLDNESRLFPRIVLRILKQLGKDSPEFQEAIVEFGDGALLAKIIEFLSHTQDDETNYQAISLLHSLLQQPSAIEPFFKKGGLASLLPVGYHADVNGTVYIFEILSVLCSSGAQYAHYFTESKILDLLHHWLWRTDDDVKYTSCALIMTLATSHPGMLNAMCESTTVANLTAILQSARSSNEKLALLVAKTMFALGRKGPSKIKVQLLNGAISSLFDDVILASDLLLLALFPTFKADAATQLCLSPQAKSPSLKSVREAIVAQVVEQEHSPRVLSAEEATKLRLQSPTASPNSLENDSLEKPQESDDDSLINSGTVVNSSENLQEALLSSFHEGINTEEEAATYRCRVEKQLNLLMIDLRILNILLGGHRIFHKIITFTGLGVQEMTLETEFSFDKLAKLATSLLDLTVLLSSKLLSPTVSATHVASSPTVKGPSDHKQSSPDSSFGTPKTSFSDLLDAKIVHDGATLDMLKLAFETESLLQAKRHASEYTLRLLSTLLRYKVFSNLLMGERILEILGGLLSQPSIPIAHQIIRVLAIFANREGTDIEAVRELKIGFLFTAPYAQGGYLGPASVSRSLKKTSLYFFSKLLIEAIADHSHTRHSDDQMCERRYSEANRLDKTSALYLSGDKLDLLNDSWSFESIRANSGVSECGRYIYEVVLWTSGIIQIGWATQSCRLDPEAGAGIGDDDNSYAFDGERCRIWHGSRSGISYGREWAAGDVVSCMIDLDSGTISYKINGVSFGVAFRDVDRSKIWFPSVSLASMQACTFRFGTALSPIQYPEEDYLPVSVRRVSDGVIYPYVPLPDKLEHARIRLEWSPWFYYEIKVGLDLPFSGGSGVNSTVIQIGLRDSNGNVLALVDFKRTHLCLVWIQGCHPVRDKAHFNHKLADYLEREYARVDDPMYNYDLPVHAHLGESKYGRFFKLAVLEMDSQVDNVTPLKPMAIQSEWSLTFEHGVTTPVSDADGNVEYPKYVVLATYNRLKLTDGDRVTIGACLDRKARFAINSHWLDPPIPFAIDLGSIPYLRNLCRFRFVTVEMPLNQNNISI